MLTRHPLFVPLSCALLLAFSAAATLLIVQQERLLCGAYF